MFSYANRLSSQGRHALVIAAFLLIAGFSPLATAADVELWRLDCGEFSSMNIEEMSDTFDYPAGRTKVMTDSCYLIRHGHDYALWDTGFSVSTAQDFKATAGEPLKSQLSRIGIDTKKISVVGISHWHPDHTGQAAQFPQARLLMGKADFQALVESKSPDIAPWTIDGAKLEKLNGDKDIFGDGTVVMLATPGHTAGHYSLLVRLQKFSPVILSGDLWHFSEQLSGNRVPLENVDRAATLASMNRILKAANNLKATIIIQHEKGDISKLPLFPASAQ
jgi:glyoxylase-like metal-dependent hydrolase (beta-lactamase superfamily II)